MPDRGDTWNRIRNPLSSECNVRSMTAYPNDHHRTARSRSIPCCEP